MKGLQPKISLWLILISASTVSSNFVRTSDFGYRLFALAQPGVTQQHRMESSWIYEASYARSCGPNKNDSFARNSSR